MDEQDRKILHILARDAKTTNAQLAEVVGLSLSACQRRVKSLEEAGAIAGYRAIIDPIHLDEAFVVFVGIRLQRHSRKIIQTFQEAIVVLDEVREVHHIAGSFDYFLRVA
ncbi:MAG: Lrp/AsnC family transcriptional regulator, partial [Cyanobacteria bacterium J06559_3]